MSRWVSVGRSTKEIRCLLDSAATISSPAALMAMTGYCESGKQAGERATQARLSDDGERRRCSR